MKRVLAAVAASLAALALAGCPKPPAPKTGAAAGAQGAEMAKEPANQNDQELYRSAMLSKNPKDRVAKLEMLLGRQQDPEAKEFVERQLAMAYAETGEIEKMEKAAANLSLDEDFPGAQVKNAMAYAYAEKGVKLDVARQNILSALNTLDKLETNRGGIPPGVDEDKLTAFVEENRGYFLDTLGWIEHRSGKDKEAVAVLEEAARRTDHGTIRYHLGEAYRAVGDPQNAAKAYAAASVEDDEDSQKAKAALEQIGKEGKADIAPLLAKAKGVHDARVAKEKAEEAAEEKRHSDAVAAAAANQREGAKRGALDYRMDVTTPEFAIEDFAGKKLGNEDLQHNVTVIDFWASWCGPCKLEMPHLQSLAEKYKGKVRFLAISEDEAKEDAVGFMQEEKYSLPTAFDDGALGRSFQITGLPTLLVIGPCGRINWVHRGFNPNIEAVLTQQIDKLIAEQNQKCEASK